MNGEQMVWGRVELLQLKLNLQEQAASFLVDLTSDVGQLLLGAMLAAALGSARSALFT